MKVSHLNRPGIMIAFGALLAIACTAGLAQDNQSQPSQAAHAGREGGGRQRGGFGDFPGGARGTMGTVTEVAASHYTIKTDAGDTYTVNFSVNTRIMKQPPGRRTGGDAAAPNAEGQGAGGQARPRRAGGEGGGDSEGDRPMPQAIKSTEIKVGDAIMAGGELDAAKKSIGAMMIMQLDPERAKQARAYEALYGKTWLAGRIKAIDGTTITLDGAVDHTPHAFQVDENTSFRKHRESITMADIKVGDQLRLEGAVKDGVFMATLVNAMEFQARDQGAPGPH
jgi:hypothetical protein